MGNEDIALETIIGQYSETDPAQIDLASWKKTRIGSNASGFNKRSH
jgi:hypothetical protein